MVQNLTNWLNMYTSDATWAVHYNNIDCNHIQSRSEGNNFNKKWNLYTSVGRKSNSLHHSKTQKCKQIILKDMKTLFSVNLTYTQLLLLWLNEFKTCLCSRWVQSGHISHRTRKEKSRSVRFWVQGSESLWVAQIIGENKVNV